MQNPIKGISANRFCRLKSKKNKSGKHANGASKRMEKAIKAINAAQNGFSLNTKNKNPNMKEEYKGSLNADAE